MIVQPRAAQVVAAVPAETAPPEAAPQRSTLLEAAIQLAQVMRYEGLTLEQTAERIEQYDDQPYPIIYSVMSNRVSSFLRALGGAELAYRAGQVVPEAQPSWPRPSYGPPLREV